MERRLAAILAADVVGYSRLMGANEAATLSALKARREELVEAKIAQHRGRLVKLSGDGILVEFPSVVNAVACATEIQREMRQRNAGVAQDRQIEFRIGINLGDIIVEENDILRGCAERCGAYRGHRQAGRCCRLGHRPRPHRQQTRPRVR